MRNLRVGYSTGTGFLSAAIRWFTRSTVSHTFFLVDEEVTGRTMIVGADANGLVMQTRERFERDSRIMDVPPLARSVDAAGIPFILQALDTPYDYPGLVGMIPVELVRWWLHKRIRNPWHSRAALFCSEAAAAMFRAVGYPGAEALDPSATDPGMLRAWQHTV